MAEQVLTEYELERLRFWAKIRIGLMVLVILLSTLVYAEQRAMVHALQHQLVNEHDLLDATIIENRRLNGLLNSPDLAGCTNNNGVLVCPVPRLFDPNGYPLEKQ